MAAASKKPTGFRIPCPRCGAVPDDDGVGGLTLALVNLTIVCPACDAEVTRADLLCLIDDARRLLAWIDLAAV